MSSNISTGNIRKRKQSIQTETSSRKRKRARVQDARTISSQTSGKAFGNGELDVEKFVRAREFEIKALERSVKRSSSALTSRAFQSVPRELRRRTASHNAKRVPKRLRARAKQEMIDDNTPTVTARRRRPSSHGWLRLEGARQSKLAALKTKLRKEKLRKERQIAKSNAEPHVPDIKKNTLQEPPKPKAKYRKRQRFKAWLPTHLFHAKRAHMTPPKEPLWRMAIPLSPTQKCYRPTHRVTSARGAMAWDMSYMSTIGLIGVEASVIQVCKSIGVGLIEGVSWWASKASRWLSGTRSWEGWVFKRDTDLSTPIAPAQIFWCKECVTEQKKTTPEASSENGRKRRAFVRIHPSAFLQLWERLLKVSKAQKPAVSVEDLRFEIGSIELAGPAAAEALVGTLWPICDADEASKQNDSPNSIWRLMSNISSPAQLPSGAMLGFNVVDPRLHHPPRTVDTRVTPQDQELLLQRMSTWPIDQTQMPQSLFDRRARILAIRQLPSQKSINRRKRLAQPGRYPDPLSTDPKIPVVVVGSKEGAGGRATWTLMLPWKCILPVWYSLMYYQLSTGGTIRFGGLEQKRQLAYEAGLPWFPGDYAGTEAGIAWEHLERKKRKASWESRPKGRRTEWESVDLGRDRKGEIGLGWACDWDHLCGNIGDDTDTSKVTLTQLVPSEAVRYLKAHTPEPLQEAAVRYVAAIKITMLHRGVAGTCARIYRLPSDDLQYRQSWLNMAKAYSRRGQPAPNFKQKPSSTDPANERRKYLTTLLLHETHSKEPAEENGPAVPDEEDLVGFVTTGNFNLSEGKGTCIGNILLDKIACMSARNQVPKEDLVRSRNLCIVRESGQSFGRLARWELI